jgi:hypothetical protein
VGRVAELGSLADFTRMAKPEHALRFETALRATDPTAALGQLAEDLKAEGMSQSSMRDLFTEYFVRVQEQGDEQSYDPIADTLDRITGWCSHGRLFDTTEDERL